MSVKWLNRFLKFIFLGMVHLLSSILSHSSFYDCVLYRFFTLYSIFSAYLLRCWGICFHFPHTKIIWLISPHGDCFVYVAALTQIDMINNTWHTVWSIYKFKMQWTYLVEEEKIQYLHFKKTHKKQTLIPSFWYLCHLWQDNIDSSEQDTIAWLILMREAHTYSVFY